MKVWLPFTVRIVLITRAAFLPFGYAVAQNAPTCASALDDTKSSLKATIDCLKEQIEQNRALSKEVKALTDQVNVLRHPTVKNVTSDRHLGVTYNNDHDGPRIVTISADRHGPGLGRTMRINISLRSDALPSKNDISTTTGSVASISFIGGNGASSATFIVPPNFYYNTTADTDDTDSVIFISWIESDF